MNFINIIYSTLLLQKQKTYIIKNKQIRKFTIASFIKFCAFILPLLLLHPRTRVKSLEKELFLNTILYN